MITHSFAQVIFNESLKIDKLETTSISYTSSIQSSKLDRSHENISTCHRMWVLSSICFLEICAVVTKCSSAQRGWKMNGHEKWCNISAKHQAVQTLFVKTVWVCVCIHIYSTIQIRNWTICSVWVYSKCLFFWCYRDVHTAHWTPYIPNKITNI